MALPSSLRRILTGLGLRLAVTALVFFLLFRRIEVSDLGESLALISPVALLGGVGGALLALGSGLVRWRVLFGAYSARTLPSWAELVRLYMIAQFYNLLPGAVGGDVVRGYATRRYFDDAGAVRSVGVVLVDRLLGFLGLLLVASIATLISPLPVGEVLMYAALGLVAALGAVTVMTLARRLADVLPDRIARLARMLPVLERPSLFVVAIALSLLSHIGVALAGYAILAGAAPQVRLLEALVIFPLGALAAYFPLTFAGAGARDTALIYLCAQYGISHGAALAASLSLLMLQLCIAAIGGLVNLRNPAPVAEVHAEAG